jgi:hypothetical protein
VQPTFFKQKRLRFGLALQTLQNFFFFPLSFSSYNQINTSSSQRLVTCY